MSVLITGGKGILGRELVKIFTNSLSPSHEELELADRGAVLRYFGEHNIDFIIHTAALANVRACEENKTKAWNSNVIGTENLVNATLQFNPNAYVVYISTACVFDGRRSMYNEDDVPYPENFYALTKLIGEFIVKKLQNYLIIRTNFVPREKWRYPKAFTDRCGTYLFADDVARAIKEVTDVKMSGIVHVVGDENMSMLDLAKITTKDVEPMTVKDYSGPKLTMNMSLDTIRWKKYKISK